MTQSDSNLGPDEDLTGRERFLGNLLVSWVTQLVTIFVGFIVPRQISSHLGAESLGIWDLGWATFASLVLLNLGGGATTNRYSALYKARGAESSLNNVVLVAIYVQLIIVCTIVGVTHSVMLLFPDFLGTTFPEANDLIFIFACAVAIKLLGDIGGGLITGRHRWDIQSWLNASQDIGIAIALIFALHAGAGVIELAYCVLGMVSITSLARLVYARLLWPEISLVNARPKYKLALEVIRYSVKSLVNNATTPIIFQTTAFVLAASTGPASLAVLSRHVALLRIVERFTEKATAMFVPMTSSLLGSNNADDARALFVSSCRISTSIMLPAFVGLIVFGDFVVTIWMGADFVDSSTMLALVVGSILPLSSSGPMAVLYGHNAHGRFGLISVCISVPLIVGCLYLTDKIAHMSTSYAAIAIGVTWTLVRGLLMPFYLNFRFGISLYAYFVEGVLPPALLATPLVACLHLSRAELLEGNWILGGGWFVSGYAALLILYWVYILSERTKRQMESMLMKFITG